MVRAVTLDLWQTLLVDPIYTLSISRRLRLESVRRLLARGGSEPSFEALGGAYEECGRRLRRIWADSQDISSGDQVLLFLECIEAGLGASLPQDLLADIAEAYTSPALRFPPELAPGAAHAIEALSDQGLTLGIVSNTGRTPGAVLRQVLGRYGVLERFAVLTFSDEARVRKPAPRIFEATLESLGTSAAETVHVGDDPEADVEGARGVGMRAIHLSRNGHPSGADLVIRSLFELPEAMARL